MSTSAKVLAGSILALGFAIALLLPNGYPCGDGEATEVHRQWSYSQERFSYGCWPGRESNGRGIPFLPLDAAIDRRIPNRVAAHFGGLLLA